MHNNKHHKIIMYNYYKVFLQCLNLKSFLLVFCIRVGGDIVMISRLRVLHIQFVVHKVRNVSGSNSEIMA